MRISDWSSDVCSSDLQHIARLRCHDRQQRWFERQERRAITGGAFGENGDGLMSGKCLPQFFYLKVYMAAGLPSDKDSMVLLRQPADDRPACYAVMGNKGTASMSTQRQYVDPVRSAEHTSELQSL